MDEFMREANLMISLPPHPNVVRMYGVSIDGTQPIIVMEYCAGGERKATQAETDTYDLSHIYLSVYIFSKNLHI